MNATAFLKNKSAATDSQVLVLTGPEPELHQQVISHVCAEVLGDDGMGPEVLDGSRASTAEILDSLSTMGLFASRRVVVLKSADNWKVEAGSPQLKEIEAYLKQPTPETWWLLSADSINKARYPFKLLVKYAEVVECQKLKGGELKAWARNHLEERGLTVPGPVLDYTLDMVGNDLGLIRNTFEKIALFTAGRESVSRKDVEVCMATEREHAMWELTNAIGSRDTKRAFEMADKLLNEGKHPLQVAASLQFQFRQLIAVRSMVQQKRSLQEIQTELKIRFFAERVVAQSKAFTPRELLDAYQRLYDLENKLKSAAADERYLLEKALFDICSATA